MTNETTDWPTNRQSECRVACTQLKNRERKLKKKERKEKAKRKERMHLEIKKETPFACVPNFMYWVILKEGLLSTSPG